MVDLCKMKLDRAGIIKQFNVDDSIKRRFLDIGIAPGTRVKRVLEDYYNNMSAYLIMGSLIAIRNTDTKGIGVIYEEI